MKRSILALAVMILAGCTSDADVTSFAEQTEASKASPYRYRVVFKPSVIIPDIELR